MQALTQNSKGRQTLTVRVDSSQDVSDNNSAHDHHDGDNEVGHESKEAEHQVARRAPAALYHLQESMRLHTSATCLQVVPYWQFTLKSTTFAHESFDCRLLNALFRKCHHGMAQLLLTK